MQSNEYNKNDKHYLSLIKYAYDNELPISEVAIQNNIKPHFLTSIKRKYGIKTKRFNVPNKRITKEIKNEMIALYESGLSSYQVAKKLGYATKKTVLDVLENQNIKRRSHLSSASYDYDFFKKIDSHDKAYILGLFYTDGYVYRNYDGIHIQLTISDKYLLERIASRFGHSATVIDIDCSAKRKKMPNALDMARLGVYSREIEEQARLLGVIRNKTHHLSLTNKIPHEFMHSFMRGVIDGDGCIGYYKSGLACKFATMSSKFASDICNYPFEEKLKAYQSKQSGIYNVHVMGGQKATLSFLCKIYENKNDLYLERKYAKVQDKIS